MSRLKLLTCVSLRAAFPYKHQNHCVSTWLLTSSLCSRSGFCDSKNRSSVISRSGSCSAFPVSLLQHFNRSKGLLQEAEVNQLRYSSVWTKKSFTYSLNKRFATKSNPDNAGKSETKTTAAATEADIFGEASKLGLFAKFKLMYKKYWYVLIPVHVVTSIGWLGTFYYMSKSGVDIPSLLHYLHLSETVIQKVQNSHVGHLAIAYLCYKIATPIRYAVTLGGTTVSIKYLVQMGYIKPMPTKNEILQMYEQKKADRAAAKAEKENVTSSKEK